MLKKKKDKTDEKSYPLKVAIFFHKLKSSGVQTRPVTAKESAKVQGFSIMW